MVSDGMKSSEARFLSLLVPVPVRDMAEPRGRRTSFRVLGGGEYECRQIQF